MGRLPIPVRLFYIGLWNVADDGGWLVWHPAELGALLFPYEAPSRRERHIVDWGSLLVSADRLRIYVCECAEVPTLPRHQRITGRLSFHQRDKHLLHTDKRLVLTGKHLIAP